MFEMNCKLDNLTEDKYKRHCVIMERDKHDILGH